MEMNYTVCGAKLKLIVLLVQETEGKRPEASEVSPVMLKPLFAIQIQRQK